MRMVFSRSMVIRRPGWVVVLWVAAAGAMGFFAPNLTRLAAEGQANLLGGMPRACGAGEALRRAWPDQAYESLVVAALHRSGGLAAADLGYATRLAKRSGATIGRRRCFACSGRARRRRSPGGCSAGTGRSRSWPCPVHLVRCPGDSRGGRLAPVAGASAQLDLPDGLEVRWAGDALIGRDYMGNVQTSLDRAAVATVVLLLGVLFAVYRSFWLALVPLATIGISLVISRGVLAWMTLAGWEVSPLVELFLVALLFGSGTDFCLFISWRFGEHWDVDDPARAMRVALERSSSTLLTSAGTVIVGLSLMGTTRFKLFSSTGPSVAIGLAITLAATLTLTPACWSSLARLRPRAFTGLTAPSSGFWERVARAALARPIVSWLATVLVMAPAGGPGSPVEFRPGRDDRDARGYDFGEESPVARHQVRYGIAGAADGRAGSDADLRGPRAWRSSMTSAGSWLASGGSWRFARRRSRSGAPGPWIRATRGAAPRGQRGTIADGVGVASGSRRG